MWVTLACVMTLAIGLPLFSMLRRPKTTRLTLDHRGLRLGDSDSLVEWDDVSLRSEGSRIFIDAGDASCELHLGRYPAQEVEVLATAMQELADRPSWERSEYEARMRRLVAAGTRRAEGS